MQTQAGLGRKVLALPTMQQVMYICSRIVWGFNLAHSDLGGMQSDNEGQAALDALADPKRAEQLQLAAYLTAATNTSSQVCATSMYPHQLQKWLAHL